MGWDLAVQLGTPDRPLFQQIVTAIAGDIERGRLRAGAKLASSRALALQLGVNRNTVIAAYDELCAQGWIAIEGTRGAFVVGVPARGGTPAVVAGFPQAAGFDLAEELALEVPAPRTPSSLLLLGGVPDLRGVPDRALARAYRAAVTGSAGRRALDYAHPQGTSRLRAALAHMLSSRRGIAAPVDAINVVRGSQHGLYLAARVLIRPGDAVCVEAPGFRPAWRALELAGATLIPVPVDRDGLDLDALEAACEARPIRAIYTTPHHQVPTTVTLTAERRARLLALAKRRRMIVLEDDYDHDFHYDGRPVLPLAAADRAGVVVYLGTLSKTLAPGLRIGYVVAPASVARQIAAYRRFVDGQGDPAVEHAVATLFEDGDLPRHVRRARARYRARRDALYDALRRRLPQLALTRPPGGMAVWAGAPGIDTDAWVARGAVAGVAFQAGSRFTFDGAALGHVRLGFAACAEAELDEAVGRMVRALPDPR